ncbi:MAG: DUF998 domain-containing protein [Saprospiraceae bacterium]|nr:DUF998 domain-containing protein [Saprospiraceae bacterium]
MKFTTPQFAPGNYPTISTTIFVLTIVVAHVFATHGYEWTKNTISDLGAQGYDRKLIMQFGFLAFGLTLTAGVLYKGLTWRSMPILMYGLCVGLTGVFCTKPFFDFDHYSEIQSMIHSALAQLAGVSFTIGILVQSFFTNHKREKWIHLTFFVLVIGLSASFGLVNHYQGIVQRLLYLTSFIWLIGFYKP